jgi:hypothetical protein
MWADNQHLIGGHYEAIAATVFRHLFRTRLVHDAGWDWSGAISNARSSRVGVTLTTKPSKCSAGWVC